MIEVNVFEEFYSTTTNKIERTQNTFTFEDPIPAKKFLLKCIRKNVLIEVFNKGELVYTFAGYGVQNSKKIVNAITF